MYALLMTLLFVVALFLILLILVQRGKGGGLAGAFGGMGGQSAFGTKAGDMFTRITLVVALFWILLCVGTLKYLSTPSSLLDDARLGKGVIPAQGALEGVPTGEGDKKATGSATGSENKGGGTATDPPANSGTTEGPKGSAAPNGETKPKTETAPE